jgi:hypothetical protein
MTLLGADNGHAAPHETVVLLGTVIAAESVMPVVPLYAIIVVPDVMPLPEIKPPTSGAVAGVAVNVKVVDGPDVLPMPDPCAVKIDALPATIRTLIGPLPKSATAFAAIGKVMAVCASAGNAVQQSSNKVSKNLRISHAIKVRAHSNTAPEELPTIPSKAGQSALFASFLNSFLALWSVLTPPSPAPPGYCRSIS